jgi:hypothetical protein
MPMKHQPLAVALLSLLATAVAAQDDRIVFVDGKVVTGARVDAFDIRSLRYNKSGRDETASADQVAKVELAKFKEVYRRGIRDADMMLTVAREQLAAKETLMAQFGFVGAAAQFFDTDRAPEGVATLDELAKSIPEAGVLPEVYRQKFEYYMGLGGRGASSALQVAKKYQNDAIGGAWPTGLSIEAEFFVALADRGTPAEFQNKLRGIVSKAGGIQPLVANRANIELAHSLRETKDYDGATRIYEDVAKRDGADGSSRAGAYLGSSRAAPRARTPSSRRCSTSCACASRRAMRGRRNTPKRSTTPCSRPASGRGLSTSTSWPVAAVYCSTSSRAPSGPSSRARVADMRAAAGRGCPCRGR